MITLPAGSRTAAMAICVVVLAAYYNSFGNSFHYDDTHSLVDNPHVRSLSNVPRFFHDPGTFSAMPEARMYRPVLLVTYALNYAMDGYELFGYHLVNLLLHLANAWLVWLVASAVSGRRGGALAAALIFAIHPVLSEPINYISSRSSLLAALFFLLAFRLLVEASQRQPTRRHHVLIPLFCLAGLGSKSIAITFAAVGAVYLATCRHPRCRPWQLLAAPSLASIAYALWTRSIIVKAVAQPVRPLLDQWATQVKAFVFYIQTAALPVELSVEPQFAVSCFWDRHVIAAALALLSLGAIVFSLRRRSPLLALAAAWSVLTLLPSSLLPLHVLVNEHRLYLPMVGACLGVGALYSASQTPRLRKIALLIGAFFIVLVIQRNSTWRNEETLWGDAVAKGPLMARPHVNVGKEYVEQGLYLEAIAASRRALAIDANLERAHYNIGTAYLHRQEMERAIASFRRALEINPDLMEAHTNLGNALKEQGLYSEAVSSYRRALTLSDNAAIHHNLGSTFLSAGLYDSAEVRFRAALDRDPSPRESWEGLAKTLRSEDRLQSAIEVLAEAFERWPQDLEFLLMVGDMQAALGRDQDAAQAYRRAGLEESVQYLRLGDEARKRGEWERARRHYERSLKSGEDARAYNGLGKVLFGLGRTAEALEAFRKAAQLKPEWAESYANIGRAYLRYGKTTEAMAALERATELEPGRAMAWGVLAQARASADDVAGAMDAYKTAIRLAPENSEFYSNLGLLYQEEGILDEALRMYGRALARNPSVEARFNMGNLLLEQKLFGEAADEYERVLEADPTFADAYVNLASAQLNLGELDGAAVSYERFLELHREEDELRRKILTQLQQLKEGEGQPTGR